MCDEEVLTWQTGDIFLTFYMLSFWNYRPWYDLYFLPGIDPRSTYYLDSEGFITVVHNLESLLLFL